MTTGTDIQNAINRLVRRRQRRQPKAITRPPVLGTSGDADTGAPAGATPVGPAGVAYVPLAEEAVHGWGEPFIVNPPMGTVQTAWDPAQKIYRVIDQSGVNGAWLVTHQRTDLACGARWWVDPTETHLISWLPIAGWRDLAVSQASVPAGDQPIFQNGDVLTYHPTAAQIFDVVHDGTYLYVAYFAGSAGGFIDRTPLTLGGGFQAPAWESTGAIDLGPPDGQSYEARYMSLKDDATEALMNVFSVGRAAPGWDIPLDDFRYYEEWTLDLSSFPTVTPTKTGDSEASRTRSWWDSEGETVDDVLTKIATSTRGFQFGSVPLAAPVRTNALLNYRLGDWSIEMFLYSWYDRQTQLRRRYTSRLIVEYEQALPNNLGYDEDNTQILPAAPVYAWCQDDGMGAEVCVIDSLGNGPLLGRWGESRRKLYARAFLSMRLDGTEFTRQTMLSQDYDETVKGGHYVNWGATGSLPCFDSTGPGDPVPCGDGYTDVQRLSLSPSPVAGQTIDEYGLEQPGSGTTLEDLDYNLTHPVVVGNGDIGDICGDLVQFATEQLIDVVDGAEQLAAGTAHHYWRIHDGRADTTLLERTLADVTASNSQLTPPTHDKHDVAASLPTPAEFEEWIKQWLLRLPLLRLYDHAIHHQPLIRMPNGTVFVSFALYDQFPTVTPQTIVYEDYFGGGDLVTLTGLDQVAATDERYTKVLTDGTSGPALILPGRQGVAGVL